MVTTNTSVDCRSRASFLYTCARDLVSRELPGGSQYCSCQWTLATQDHCKVMFSVRTPAKSAYLVPVQTSFQSAAGQAPIPVQTQVPSTTDPSCLVMGIYAVVQCPGYNYVFPPSFSELTPIPFQSSAGQSHTLWKRLQHTSVAMHKKPPK